jgi:hypothetical protein
MVKFSLFLVITAFAAAHASKKDLLRSRVSGVERKLQTKGNKGTSSKGKGATTCGGKGKGSTGSVGKGGKGSSDVCTEPIAPLLCGATIDNIQVQLATSLGCTADLTALTVVGPEAVLDCNGNMVYRVTDGVANPLADGSIGILLLDGATAINCYVKGYGVGVEIDGDGTLADSTVFRNRVGVSVSGTDMCASIDNTRILNNEEDAIRTDDDPTGSLVVSGSQLLANGEEGIDASTTGDLALVVEDTDIIGNLGSGIDVSGPDVSLAGSNVILANTEEGLFVQSGTTATINDTTSIYGSGAEGIVGDGSVILAEGSSVTVCESTATDITVTSVQDLSAGGLVCDSSTTAGLMCSSGCVASQEASSCSV